MREIFPLLPREKIHKTRGCIFLPLIRPRPKSAILCHAWRLWWIKDHFPQVRESSLSRGKEYLAAFFRASCVPDGRSLLLLFAAPSPPALDGPDRARTWGGAQPTARAIRAASSGANVSFSLKRRRLLQRRVNNGHPLLGRQRRRRRRASAAPKVERARMAPADGSSLYI